MASSGIKSRFFVVGTPRSGTTLVQSLLAAHSGVISFTESHFFSRHFSRVPFSPWVVLTSDPLPRLREFLRENGVSPGGDAVELEAGVGRCLGGRLVRPFRSWRVAEELLRVFDRLANARGSSSWVEKTPRHLRYLPFLEQISGRRVDTRFVHVIRDGLETVASLYVASRSWERPHDLRTCVRRWNEDLGFSLERASAPSDSFVFYEELTSRPEKTLASLFDRLDLAWEPEILDRYATVAASLITADERWKGNVSRDIEPSATSGEVLSEDQRERVQRSLRHDLYSELYRHMR